MQVGRRPFNQRTTTRAAFFVPKHEKQQSLEWAMTVQYSLRGVNPLKSVQLHVLPGLLCRESSCRKRHAVSSSRQLPVVCQNSFLQSTSRSLVLAENPLAPLSEVRSRRNEVSRSPFLRQFRAVICYKQQNQHPVARRGHAPEHLCFVAVRQASVRLRVSRA